MSRPCGPWLEPIRPVVLPEHGRKRAKPERGDSGGECGPGFMPDTSRASGTVDPSRRKAPQDDAAATKSRLSKGPRPVCVARSRDQGPREQRELPPSPAPSGRRACPVPTGDRAPTTGKVVRHGRRAGAKSERRFQARSPQVELEGFAHSSRALARRPRTRRFPPTPGEREVRPCFLRPPARSWSNLRLPPDTGGVRDLDGSVGESNGAGYDPLW